MAELHQVHRCQITRRIIKEHIFRAWVGGVNATPFRTSMPFVNCGVILQARIGAGPCCMGDLFPKVSGFDTLGNTVVAAFDQFPIALIQNGLQILVANPYGIV